MEVHLSLFVFDLDMFFFIFSWLTEKCWSAQVCRGNL